MEENVSIDNSLLFPSAQPSVLPGGREAWGTHDLLCFSLPTGKDLSVDITAAKSSLSEGDTLQLHCMVGAQKSSSRHFQVLWLLNGVEVARVDPYGVLIWEKEYEERAKLGQLQAFKQNNTIYVLAVYDVGLKDNGTYRCSVSEVKTTGDFHSTQTNLSSGIQVNVKPIG